MAPKTVLWCRRARKLGRRKVPRGLLWRLCAQTCGQPGLKPSPLPLLPLPSPLQTLPAGRAAQQQSARQALFHSSWLAEGLCR